MYRRNSSGGSITPRGSPCLCVAELKLSQFIWTLALRFDCKTPNQRVKGIGRPSDDAAKPPLPTGMHVRQATCYQCQRKGHIKKIYRSQTLILASMAEKDPHESQTPMSIFFVFFVPSFDKPPWHSEGLPGARVLYGTYRDAWQD